MERNQYSNRKGLEDRTNLNDAIYEVNEYVQENYSQPIEIDFMINSQQNEEYVNKIIALEDIMYTPRFAEELAKKPTLQNYRIVTADCEACENGDIIPTVELDHLRMWRSVMNPDNVNHKIFTSDYIEGTLQQTNKNSLEGRDKNYMLNFHLPQEEAAEKGGIKNHTQRYAAFLASDKSKDIKENKPELYSELDRNLNREIMEKTTNLLSEFNKLKTKHYGIVWEENQIAKNKERLDESKSLLENGRGERLKEMNEELYNIFKGEVSEQEKAYKTRNNFLIKDLKIKIPDEIIWKKVGYENRETNLGPLGEGSFKKVNDELPVKLKKALPIKSGSKTEAKYRNYLADSVRHGILNVNEAETLWNEENRTRKNFFKVKKGLDKFEDQFTVEKYTGQEFENVIDGILHNARYLDNDELRDATESLAQEYKHAESLAGPVKEVQILYRKSPLIDEAEHVIVSFKPANKNKEEYILGNNEYTTELITDDFKKTLPKFTFVSQRHRGFATVKPFDPNDSDFTEMSDEEAVKRETARMYVEHNAMPTRENFVKYAPGLFKHLKSQEENGIFKKKTKADKLLPNSNIMAENLFYKLSKKGIDDDKFYKRYEKEITDEGKEIGNKWNIRVLATATVASLGLAGLVGYTAVKLGDTISKNNEQDHRLDYHDQQIDDIYDRLNDNDHRIEYQDREIDNHEDLLDSYQDRLDDLEDRIDASEDRLDDAEERLTNGDITLNEYQIMLDNHGDLLNDHENLLDEYKNQLDDHESILDNQGDTINNYHTTIIENTETIEDNSDRLDSVEDRLDDHDDKIEDLEEDRDDHEDRLNDYEDRLNDIEDKNDEQDERLDNHEDRLDDYEDRIINLEDQYQQIQNDYNSLLNNVTNLETNATEQQNLIDNLTNDYKSLLENLTDLQDDFSDQLQNNTEQQQDINDLKDRLGDLQNNVTNLEDYVDNMEDYLDRAIYGQYDMSNITKADPFTQSDMIEKVKIFKDQGHDEFNYSRTFDWRNQTDRDKIVNTGVLDQSMIDYLDDLVNQTAEKVEVAAYDAYGQGGLFVVDAGEDQIYEAVIGIEDDADVEEIIEAGEN